MPFTAPRSLKKRRELRDSSIGAHGPRAPIELSGLMMSAGRLLEHAAAPPWGEGAQGLEVNAAVRWPQYEVSKRLDTRQPAL